MFFAALHRQTRPGPAPDASPRPGPRPRPARALLIAAMITAAGAAAPAAAQTVVLDERVESSIAAVEDRVIAWRRDIHQHPELGNREFRTASLVADHLRALGIEVTTEVAHTGVVGVLRGGRPGPVVALRADMDALPVTERVDVPFASRVRSVFNGEEVGVMHACGHDTHVAILMGVAEVLAGMRDDLEGTVKFIFQPAEEGAPIGEEGGAELMVKEGVLSNPDVDVAFGLHISSLDEVGHIHYTPRGALASVDDFRILIRGEQTHGAAPWGGVDPILTAAHIVTALQTVVSRNVDITKNPAIVTIGQIRGGVRSNIIPEEAELIGTLRALSAEDRELIHNRVRTIATSVAEAMGAHVEVQIPLSSSYPVTYNDPELTEEMLPILEGVAGTGRVIRDPPITGAEDFSFFAEKVPALFIFLGGRPSNVSREDAPEHHTPDFYVDDSGLQLGVRAMTAMTLHYMRTRAGARAGTE
jgi:amidohydrolase